MSSLGFYYKIFNKYEAIDMKYIKVHMQYSSS